MLAQKTLVLWRQGDWRCELHPGSGGDSRLEVYRAEQLVTSESTLSAYIAERRGEVFRQRVLRGDLRADC